MFVGPLGLSWAALDWKGLRIGPSIGLAGGRTEADDPHLEGMGDIRSSLAAGFFASYRFERFDVSAKLRQSVNHSENGMQALLQLDYHLPLIPRKLTLTLGPEIELGTGEYNSTWFGVTATQSTASGLPPFAPRGGLNAVGVNASLTYHLGDDWLLRAYGNVKSLQNDAARSPLVQSTTQRTVGIGIAYHF